MDLVTLSPETDQAREAYFKTVFGRESGFVCLAYMKPKDRESFTETFFKYPEDLPRMLKAINEVVRGHNVYFCPQLLSQRTRRKETVQATPNAWADLDFCDPDNLLVKPTVTIESSPGRYQAIWVFDRQVDPDDAEDLSRRIAYKHADDGADRSGWDLSQLLRVPITYNYNHRIETEAKVPIVKVIDISRSRYRLDDFKEHYPAVSEYHTVDIPMPEEAELPQQDGNELLTERRLELNAKIWQLFLDEPGTSYDLDKDGWSKPLWNLQMMLFEAGFSREEVFVIAKDAACNKYDRDGKPLHLLWKEVCRADAKNQANLRILAEGVKDDEEPVLLSDKERERVTNLDDTFIERYIGWARTLGDAAPQYHQAGAFMSLSSLLAGPVRLPTSFGTILPNLWFMILADSTITRKSTSMDTATDLIQSIDPDTLLATDGSLEGLLSAISGRSGRPSIFLRDEFSGLLEMMTKRDYYAGMAETLTKLYDGKTQKRVLRKETVEIHEPVLIVYAGGIKNRVTSLLTWEHVSSGFLPRFIFITAESDVTKIRPIGPPTTATRESGSAIQDELNDIYAHYRRNMTVTIKGVKGPQASIEQPRMWEAELTADAWVRYNQLETQMIEIALKTDLREIMTPTYDRLSKSILKAAVLLAAARQRNERIVVEEMDILRAIMYGEQWRVHVREVMKNVGKGVEERQYDSVVRMIERHPGVARSKIMQHFHFNARTADQVLVTLEQRGLVVKQKAGRTEQFWPTNPVPNVHTTKEGTKR